MSYKIIPLAPKSNQSLTCTLPVDGKNISLSLSFTYNEPGGYWFMSIADAKTNMMILDAVPLVTGEYPAADLLGQYEYLGIGSATIVPTSSLSSDIPDFDTLGTDYVLVWGDTIQSY